jgi:hypothetical protein
MALPIELKALSVTGFITPSLMFCKLLGSSNVQIGVANPDLLRDDNYAFHAAQYGYRLLRPMDCSTELWIAPYRVEINRI